MTFTSAFLLEVITRLKMYNGSILGLFYTRKLNLVCYLGHNLGTFYASKLKFATYPDLLYFRHLSVSHFLLGALHRRKNFANFCHELMQNHLS